MNTRLLDALRCQNKGRPPVWLMRQAGRYLPEYRALRERYSFLEMCRQPDIAAAVTRLPVDLLNVDAAILFSDILVIPDAFGLGLRFTDQSGPLFEKIIETDADVEALPIPNIEETLGFVAATIRTVKPTLQVPLIGFCGAPFTVASYMIEGKTSRTLKKTKQWMVRNPAGFHLLLQKITDATAAYLQSQIDAGVDAIQIFDSWAQVLSHEHFREFSLAYMEPLLRVAKKNGIPAVLFCRGSSVFAPTMSEVAPSAISLDWQVSIGEMRKRIPDSIALQGNLDPDLLYASNATIRASVQKILHEMKGEPGYIFNLGHGIFPDIPVDAVKTLIDCVHSA